jgi:hypothetical protein
MSFGGPCSRLGYQGPSLSSIGAIGDIILQAKEMSEKLSSGIHSKPSKREEDPFAIHTRTREFRVTLAGFSISVLETEGVERFIDAAFTIVTICV